MLIFGSLNLGLDILNCFYYAKSAHIFGYNISRTCDKTLDEGVGDEDEGEGNMNMCSAYTHVFADTLRSLAVIIAAVVSER